LQQLAGGSLRKCRAQRKGVVKRERAGQEGRRGWNRRLSKTMETFYQWLAPRFGMKEEKRRFVQISIQGEKKFFSVKGAAKRSGNFRREKRPQGERGKGKSSSGGGEKFTKVSRNDYSSQMLRRKKKNEPARGGEHPHQSFRNVGERNRGTRWRMENVTKLKKGEGKSPTYIARCRAQRCREELVGRGKKRSLKILKTRSIPAFGTTSSHTEEEKRKINQGGTKIEPVRRRE